MNERFAADPTCCSTATELKSFLEKFGVFTGRYLSSYPDDWARRLQAHLSSVSPLDAARISILLQRARDKWGVIGMPSLMWMDHLSWTDNAAKLASATPPKLDRLVIPNNAPRIPLKGTAIDDLDVPPTAEERIRSTPEEYVRVTRTHLQLAHELLLIDPYLNPCSRYIAPVLHAIFSVVGCGKRTTRLIKCFAHAKKVLKDGCTADEIQIALESILSTVEGDTPMKIVFFLVDDFQSKDPMHDRYLLSVKGGVQLSKGFQIQSRNAKVAASPMGPNLHRDAWTTYMDWKTDMKIVHTISLQR